MNINSFLSAGLVGASIVVVGAQFAPAQAFSLSTSNVTNNGSTNVASNFSINVTGTANTVSFTFNNVKNVAEATITDIYFGTRDYFNNYFTGAATIKQVGKLSKNTGVSFSQTNDPNAGGGIKWTSAYTADADNPGYNKLGVDAGETITFNFNLISGVSLADVEDGFNSGALALAFHVQSIGGDNGYSDWFATKDVTAKDIPEPITLLGTSAALGFGAAFKKRLSQRKKQEA